MPAPRHKLSAFVIEVTVFLEVAGQLPRALRSWSVSAPLGCLRVQPRQSKLFFLHLDLRKAEFFSIPVLSHGDMTRYLGYSVGLAKSWTRQWQRISAPSNGAWRSRLSSRPVSSFECWALCHHVTINFINGAVFEPSAMGGMLAAKSPEEISVVLLDTYGWFTPHLAQVS